MTSIPPWLSAMRAITGMTEVSGSGSNPKIVAMSQAIADAFPDVAGLQAYADVYTSDDIAWCGLAVAYCMARSGILGPFGRTDTDKYLWAQAWSDWDLPDGRSGAILLDQPVLGCVVVMTRSGGGHVTLYEEDAGSSIRCRGGNQSDSVNVSSYPKANVLAYVWPADAPPPPPAPRRMLERGDTGQDVAQLQASLGIPADGQFGSVTEAAVMAYQSATGLIPDGIVGPQTWGRVDMLDERKEAGGEGLSEQLMDEISALAANSPVLNYPWKDRGLAPPAFVDGLALSFAAAVQYFNNGYRPALEMSRAMTNDAETDALKYYQAEFAAKGMDNSHDGLPVLRHLFVMLMGLGMRESSGKYYEGKDASASNTDSLTCEAGAWQTSWNIESADSDNMGQLFYDYTHDPNGFLPAYQDGLSPTASGLKVYGTGEGATYQWLAKYAPLFAALVTGLGLRKRRAHWGPIGRREVEIVTSVDDLLRSVQQLVETAQPEPEPEPEPEQATVDIVTAGPVMVTVNGKVVT